MEIAPPLNALPITGKSIPKVDFELPLRDANEPHCHSFEDVYLRAVKDEPDPHVGDLFRSLKVICSFHPQYFNRAQPYGPAYRSGDRRSTIPDDLTAADLDVIETLLPLAKMPALRARLADVIWLRRKDRHEIGRGAVRDYVAAAQELIKPSGWIHAVELFHRALQLAANLGRQKKEYQLAEEALLQALDDPLSQIEPFFANHFLHLILTLGIGDPNAMADAAKAQADLPLIGNDPSRRRGYHRLESEFRQVAGDAARARGARLLAAETYIEESDDAVKRTPASFMVACDALAKGIEALRQAQAGPERIAELKEMLKDFQKRVGDEMQTIRIPFGDEFVRNVETAAKASAEYVDRDDFRRSLLLLALGMDCISVPDLKEEVLKGIEQAPFIHIIGESMIDSEGRITGHKKPLLGLTGDEAERELENRMFHHAAEFDWKWRVATFIEPARGQIWTKHRPRLRDLEYLVINNPFIPPGHEGIFLQGLFYGLAGDFMIASHLLTPQIENSIRHVLEQSGADITNLHSDLTQAVKTLGPLFDVPEMNSIFGPNLIFEMRGLLIEKHGYPFRHDVAHGFVSQGDCYGHAAINVWWLVLKLCHSATILPPDVVDGLTD